MNDKTKTPVSEDVVNTLQITPVRKNEMSERTMIEQVASSPTSRLASMFKSQSLDIITLPSVLAGNTDILTPSPTKTSSANPIEIEEDATTASFNYNKFLDQLRQASCFTLLRYIRNFIKEFNSRPLQPDDQQIVVANFFQLMHSRMDRHELWRNVSPAEFDNAKEGLEKLLLSNHIRAFCPVGSDYEKRDAVLNQKILLHDWIEPRHLDISDKCDQDFVNAAKTQLLKINDYKAPRDKLICILNCCKVIYGLIENLQSEGSADQFLPIFIYIVIKANPSHLYSNIQYISRYRNPDNLQSEFGYYFTNLTAVVEFIEKLDQSGLSISLEEYSENTAKAYVTLPPDCPANSDPSKPQSQSEVMISKLKSARSAFFEKPIAYFNKWFSSEFPGNTGVSPSNSAPNPSDEISPPGSGKGMAANQSTFSSAYQEQADLEDYDLQLALALSLSEAATNPNTSLPDQPLEHFLEAEVINVSNEFNADVDEKDQKGGAIGKIKSPPKSDFSLIDEPLPLLHIQPLQDVFKSENDSSQHLTQVNIAS